MSRFLPTLPLFLVLAAGCASLPRPEPEDVVRGRTRFSELDLQRLSTGRNAYVQRCGGCHALHLPKRLSADAWPAMLTKMQEEIELSPAERSVIEQFLVTMALRPESSASP